MKQLLLASTALILTCFAALAGTADRFTGPAEFETGSVATFKSGSTLTLDNGATATGITRKLYLGTPAAADADNLVAASTDMKVGAYTVADTTPDGTIPRNVTVTHTATSTVDTLGTIVVVGTDAADAVLTETITPLNGTIASGTKAFKTITSITGAGWVVAAGADTISVGYGNLVGLPVVLPSGSSYTLTTLDATVASSVTTGGTLGTSTVNASGGTFTGSKKLFVYLDR